MSKKILISVSYGASSDALAADIGCIEHAMQAAYPDWELRRAFTSGRLRAMWARQGHPVPDPAEAIAQAKADGAEQIALATLLVSPGGEFEGAESAAQTLPVVTPLLTDSILPGITRKSCIELLRAKGYSVSERLLSVDELVSTLERGTLEEAWGCGTAAVVSPIGRLAYGEKVYEVGSRQIGPVTQLLYDTLTGIQRGRIEDAFGWIMSVC